LEKLFVYLTWPLLKERNNTQPLLVEMTLLFLNSTIVEEFLLGIDLLLKWKSKKFG